MFLITLMFSLLSSASDPTGIYGQISKVERGEHHRLGHWIKISGNFRQAPAVRGQGNVYLPTQSGYLYYLCPMGKLEICEAEWTDLENSITSGRCVAFGARAGSNGIVRDHSWPAMGLDVFPIGMGVRMVGCELFNESPE